MTGQMNELNAREDRALANPSELRHKRHKLPRDVKLILQQSVTGRYFVEEPERSLGVVSYELRLRESGLT
jgi:hypothetical protein